MWKVLSFVCQRGNSFWKGKKENCYWWKVTACLNLRKQSHSLQWRSGQSRQNTWEIMGKSKGKERILVVAKRHEWMPNTAPGLAVGCLEEIAKLRYTASLLRKWGRRLGPCSLKIIYFFSISDYSHLSYHRRRFWDLCHKWQDVDGFEKAACTPETHLGKNHHALEVWFRRFYRTFYRTF